MKYIKLWESTDNDKKYRILPVETTELEEYLQKYKSVPLEDDEWAKIESYFNENDWTGDFKRAQKVVKFKFREINFNKEILFFSLKKENNTHFWFFKLEDDYFIVSADLFKLHHVDYLCDEFEGVVQLMDHLTKKYFNLL